LVLKVLPGFDQSNMQVIATGAAGSPRVATGLRRSR
jgi:hypothetical protein